MHIVILKNTLIIYLLDPKMLISCLRNSERKEPSTEQEPSVGKGHQKVLSPQKKSLSFASSASSRSNSVSILKSSFENDFVIQQGEI